MPHLAARDRDARRRGSPDAGPPHLARLQRGSELHDGRLGRARELGGDQRHALGADAVLGAEASAVQGADRARTGRLWRRRRVQARGQGRQARAHAGVDLARHVHGGTARGRQRDRLWLRQRREHDAALGRARPRGRRAGPHPGIDARDPLRPRRADRQGALVERRSDRVVEPLQRAVGGERPRLHRDLRWCFVLLRSEAMRAALAVAASLSIGGVLCAQGRGGSEWTTASFDAQRSGWVRTDPRISVQTMTKPGDFGAFKFLWKLKLEYDPKVATALTQPVLLDRIIGFRGFKSVAFVATQSETVHAIDYDFGTTLWKYHVNYTASPPPVTGGTAECPAGLTAAVTRPTAYAPSAGGGRGGGGGGGARSGGGVGEPGKGAITLATAGQRGRGAPAPPAPAPAGAPSAPGGGVAPGSAAAAAGNQPGGLPGGARQGGPGGGGRGGPFQPGDDAAYVVGSDGYLHALNVQNGWDNMTPALFVPPNTYPAGLIVATSDAGAVAYTATRHRCGSQPDAVWAMDLADPQKAVRAFKVGDAVIAGASGPSIGRDGILYIATAAGAAPESSSVFALEPKTVKQKAAAKVGGINFNTSPLVFTWKDKDAVLVAGGGKLYLFDAASLANGPIATSASFGAADVDTGALASWTDAGGARWIAAPSAKGIVTFKPADEGGRPPFQARGH